jgi:hypothetical protein
MMTTLLLLLFCVLCMAILTLPFVPTLREWRRPSDCSPLPIARQYANEIDYFARQFRRDAIAEIGTKDGAIREFDYLSESPDNVNWPAMTRPVIALRGLHATNPIRCRQPIFVTTNLTAPRDSSLAAVLACGDIRLGASSEILDWGHADGAIQLGPSCVALRRLSSRTSIDLAAQCCFERLQAPVIRFGEADTKFVPPPPLAGARSELRTLPGAIRRTDDLHLIRGDCSLPPGHLYKGSLVVLGHLIVGNHTTLIGDIKVRQGAIIGAGARIIGSLICDDRIYILDHASIAGPVVSETDIVIGSGAVIGARDAPTTISADNLMAGCGAVTHGAVWARNVGVVWEP